MFQRVDKLWSQTLLQIVAPLAGTSPKAGNSEVPKPPGMPISIQNRKPKILPHGLRVSGGTSSPLSRRQPSSTL